MDNLFDVAQADPLKVIKNLEDRDFFLAQWELGLAQKEDAAQKKEAEARRAERLQME